MYESMDLIYYCNWLAKPRSNHFFVRDFASTPLRFKTVMIQSLHDKANVISPSRVSTIYKSINNHHFSLLSSYTPNIIIII